MPRTVHQSQRPRTSSRWGAVLAAIGGCTAAAVAGGPVPTDFYWEASTEPDNPVAAELASLGEWTNIDESTTVYTGSLLSTAWHLTWTTTVTNGTDQVIDTMLSVTNLGATTQSFSTATSLPSPLADGASMLSLACSLSVTNLQFSGAATLSTIGDDPLTSASMDSGEGIANFDAVYELTANGPFGVATDAADTMTTMEAIDPNGLSVWARFMLTPGDTTTLHLLAAYTTIPAPPTSLLMALAWCLTPSRRRS